MIEGRLGPDTQGCNSSLPKQLGWFWNIFFDFFSGEVAITNAKGDSPKQLSSELVLTATKIPNREGKGLLPGGSRSFLKHTGWGWP